MVATLALAGCGGSKASNQPPPGVSGAGPSLSAPINLADCSDWKNGSLAQRLGTIHQLKNFAGGEVVGSSAAAPAGSGAVLDDKRAYDLLDGACKNAFARGFKLYKLYERAAAFSGQPAR